MLENMDDNEFLYVIWNDSTDREDFLSLVDEHRPYLYEEAKYYLLRLEGARNE